MTSRNIRYKRRRRKQVLKVKLYFNDLEWDLFLQRL